MLGAVSLAAAVSYGIYSMSREKDQFQDAVEGEAEEQVVKVKRHDDLLMKEEGRGKWGQSGDDIRASFL